MNELLKIQLKICKYKIKKIYKNKKKYFKKKNQKNNKN